MGLGINWQWGNTVSARLDWGYPIFRRGSLDDTWQNNGFSFSIIITPF
jgi:hemolysin activation/secretion protein